jgi:hypothetical protein
MKVQPRRLVLFGLLCSVTLSFASVGYALTTKEQNKLIKEDEKAVKQAIQQVHKDIVKHDDARLAADQAVLAAAQAKLNTDRGVTVGTSEM